VSADQLIERAADVLREAVVRREPCAPIRTIVGTSTDIDVGYAIQQRNTSHDVAEGRRVCGRKIGVTSKAVMRQVGVDQPDFGTLFADMEFGDGVPLPAARLIQPRAEAEVALVLEHDLDKGTHTFNDIIGATAYALPAIEVVDSRIARWDISIVDTIADNASCGLYVLGGRPVRLGRLDLRTVPMSMSINEAVVSTGIGHACLGHPLHAARWLADTMSQRGTPLRSGDVVLTGALGPMQPIRPGDLVEATFGDLGRVTTAIDLHA
jgi:2-keto-4-pentenoate hydratase